MDQTQSIDYRLLVDNLSTAILLVDRDLNIFYLNSSCEALFDISLIRATIAQAMIDARKESGLTQKQLSERTGIAQADISKLERGNANPSLRTLQRLAAGMGMNVKIEFVTNK
jgi:DNA-binding XRE family transcriptional regulator